MAVTMERAARAVPAERLKDSTRPAVQRRAQALANAGHPTESGFGVNSAREQAMVDVRARYNRMTLSARTNEVPSY